MGNIVINTPELLNLDSTTGATILAKGTVNERPATPTFSVDYLVVAGGGASNRYNGGGAGAGGLRTSYGSTSGGGASAESSLTLSTNTNYTVTVGAGGTQNDATAPTSANDGNDSVFSTITSIGGGAGGVRTSNSSGAARDGGSGGGGGSFSSGGNQAGSGTANQGYNGANGADGGSYQGGGGGGAAAAGTRPNGGAGLAVNILNGTNAGTASVGEISGSNVYFAGGGGAGANISAGSGGIGGGGNGCTCYTMGNGDPNTGGGGGGGAMGGTISGGNGGSGVVILRYPNSVSATVNGATQASGSPFTEGNDKITVLTSGTGTITFTDSTPTNPDEYPINGTLRFNTETNKTEYFDGTDWYEIVDEYASGFVGPGTNYFDTKLYTGNGSTQSIDGYINGSASFNGSSSNIQIPTTATTPFDASSEDFAISLWVNINNFGNSDAIINKWGSSTSLRSYWLGLGPSGSNNKIYIYEQGSSFNTFASTTTLNASQWHHIVYVRNATQLLLYIDNVLQTFSATNAINQGGTETLAIGQQLGFSGATLDGSIDQVRIYNVALSSSDVAALNLETAATATTAAFPSGQTAIATYTMDTSANGLLTTTDLSTVDYPAGAGCYVLYEMNGNSNDTNNTYNGTPINITYQGGAFDQAAVFNGSNSKIDTGIASISSPFSVSMWINEDVLDSGVFFGNWNSTSADMYWQTTSDGRLRISIDGFSQQFFGTAGDVTAKTWHHIAVALGSGVYEVYLDGTSLGTSTTSVTTFSSGQNFMVGDASKPSTPLPFDGLIDQVRIFNTKLTQSQVTTLARGIATSYSGAATNVNFNGHLNFQPGLTWIKQRNGSASHSLQDSVRGAGQSKNIYSDNTAAEGTYGQYGYLSSFDTNGFTVEAGSGSHTNANGSTYVSWNWKGGGGAVTNNDGTIASQVSANKDSGFSIVKYTGGNGASDTVGHGLADAEMIILKDLTDGTNNWRAWHKDLTSGHWLYLNLANAQASAATDGGIRNVDANTFGFINGTTGGVEGVNSSASDYIAYVWKSISGYSRIGSYTGTGATSSFTGFGFQPRWITIKRTDSTGNWWAFDSTRGNNKGLRLNLSNAEDTTDADANTNEYRINFLSDGFQYEIDNSTSASPDLNASSGTYIYLAIA